MQVSQQVFLQPYNFCGAFRLLCLVRRSFAVFSKKEVPDLKGLNMVLTADFILLIHFF